MSRLESIGDALWDRVQDGVTDARQAYAGANRWARMRIWVLVILGLDAVLTVVGVLAFSASPRVEAWFEPGFPHDMVIVRNLDDSPLRDVVLLIDGRFRHRVDKIPAEGSSGFDLVRDFADGTGRGPDDGYVPQTLVVTHTRGEREIALE
ncbi:MAG: hypothetical protein AAGD10_19685 [Myxococcota bacterium]